MKVTVPSEEGIWFMIADISVVLPAPFAPIIVDQVFETIVRINESGTTILLVEQNANQALRIAKRGYVIETGEVVLEDDAASLMQNERVREAYLGA